MKPTVLSPDDVSSSSGPITPEQAPLMKVNTIPQFVFEAFNDAIARDYDRGSATVSQPKIMIAICERMKTMPEFAELFPANEPRGIDDNQSAFSTCRRHVFANKWLDVEEAYRAAGWLVRYDKPGFNEDYDAYWEFMKIPKRRSTDK